jgi:DNA repair protein RecO (recombination protein O)
MQYKTRGIVLYSLNYNDIYSIVHIFTEEFGIIPYLSARVKGKNSKVPKSLFHPMAVLDLEVEHQNLREIQRLKEARVHVSSSSLLVDPVKSAICIFLAEFIGKIAKDFQSDKLLFDYILQSVQILDLSTDNYANFHLVFLLRLTQFMGFFPDWSGYRKGMFFDMQNGVFTLYKPLHVHFLNPDESEIFSQLLRMSYDNMHRFRFSRNERRDIIYKLIEYYRLHLVHFSDLKSLEILHEVFG